ncbi:MAG: TetR/AcrR family transcriptional regulator [Spirochaetes bacterium]|nr:TetR/AcrR family transcriptional regulator [Spirochaetota bacterium]
MENDTKTIILQAATKDFLSNGYDKSSLNDLVKKCGVTKGAFYHYFKTKDDLFLEVMNTMFGEIDKWITEMTNSCKTFKDFLFSYFNYPSFFSKWSGSMGISANMYRLIFDAITVFPFLKTRISDSYKNYFKDIENRIIEAQKSGELRNDINPDNLSVHLTVLVEGFILFEVLLEDENLISEKALRIAEDIWEKIKNEK